MNKTQTETASLYVSRLLKIALENHSVLLQSGLSPNEAESATLSGVVVRALDASTPRVREKFRLCMQHLVQQSVQHHSVS